MWRAQVGESLIYEIIESTKYWVSLRTIGAQLPTSDLPSSHRLPRRGPDLAEETRTVPFQMGRRSAYFR